MQEPNQEPKPSQEWLAWQKQLMEQGRPQSSLPGPDYNPPQPPDPDRWQLPAISQPQPAIHLQGGQSTVWWPAAVAVLLLVGSAALLWSNSPTFGLFFNVLVAALLIAVIAAWFGYGVALMVRGVQGGGTSQTFIGAVVVASAFAAPYLLFVSGILKIINR